MTRYELLTFLHLASVVIWLGAGFLLAVLVFGAERAGDRMKEAGHHRDVAWLAPRLFIPASISSLVFGILLVVDGPWTFEYLWINIALVGWLISFALGFLYFRPEGERIGAIAEREGPDSAEVARRIHRLNIVDRLQLLILFLMIADMVIRPTGDDGGVLIAGAAILVATWGYGLAMIRRGPAAEAASAPSGA